MQGRLIQAFLARVRRLDTLHTGYDDVLREVVRDASTTLPAAATSQRHEHDAVDLPCQVSPEDIDALRMVAGGNDPARDLVLTTHYKHLRLLGMVAADGKALIDVGARIEALLSIRTRAAIYEFPDPPGLFVVKAEPRGWGLDMGNPRLNLLDLRCNVRQRAEAT